MKSFMVESTIIVEHTKGNPQSLEILLLLWIQKTQFISDLRLNFAINPTGQTHGSHELKCTYMNTDSMFTGMLTPHAQICPLISFPPNLRFKKALKPSKSFPRGEKK